MVVPIVKPVLAMSGGGGNYIPLSVLVVPIAKIAFAMFGWLGNNFVSALCLCRLRKSFLQCLARKEKVFPLRYGRAHCLTRFCNVWRARQCSCLSVVVVPIAKIVFAMSGGQRNYIFFAFWTCPLLNPF